MSIYALPPTSAFSFNLTSGLDIRTSRRHKASIKVRSHQTRMTRIAQMIYMLKSMQRRERQSCGANGALFSRELKNLNFGGYSRRVNQSGACSSSDVITSGGRKSQTTMEDKVIVVVCGYPELYKHLRTFTKTGIHFATRLELPAEAPPMTRIRICCVVNFTRE